MRFKLWKGHTLERELVGHLERMLRRWRLELLQLY